MSKLYKIKHITRNGALGERIPSPNGVLVTEGKIHPKMIYPSRQKGKVIIFLERYMRI